MISDWHVWILVRILTVQKLWDLWWVGELWVIKIKISYSVFFVTIISIYILIQGEQLLLVCCYLSDQYWPLFSGVLKLLSPDWESHFINLAFGESNSPNRYSWFSCIWAPLVNQMIFELALKDTAFNFATQLAATCPRVTEIRLI